MDARFARCDTKPSPRRVLKAGNKKCARLNCITHLLSMVPFKDLTPTPPELSTRPVMPPDCVQPPIEDRTFVPGLG